MRWRRSYVADSTVGLPTAPSPPMDGRETEEEWGPTKFWGKLTPLYELV